VESQPSFERSLPDVLRESRHRLDLTMMEMAEKIGVGYTTINKWETGLCCVSPGRIPKMSEHYRLSIKMLEQLCVEFRKKQHRVLYKHRFQSKVEIPPPKTVYETFVGSCSLREIKSAIRDEQLTREWS